MALIPSGWRTGTAALYLVFFGCHVAAGVGPPTQTPDTLFLPEIQVLGTRLPLEPHLQPVFIQRADSASLRRSHYASAAEVLGQHSFAMIRDYGGGNMALVSQRGFSPSHTRVVWEGLPLNHPMLGMTDLSLVPAGLFDGLSAASGNPAALTGSGEIGGTVAMHTRERDEKAWLSRTSGSWGFEQTTAGASMQQGRFGVDVRLVQQQADYDYPYYDPVRGQERTRTGNAMRSGHLMGQLSYSNRHLQLRSLFWMDDIRNDIPGPITALAPGTQLDRAMRSLWIATWNRPERTDVTFLAGWVRNELDYTQRRTSRTDKSTAGTLLMQPTLRHTWNEHQQSWLTFELSSQQLTSDNYRDPITEQRYSSRLNHVLRLRSSISVYPSLAWEYDTRYGQSWNPSLALTAQPLGSWLVMRLSTGYNRNIPTFNDLYWHPGGNPELRPEQVFSLETGVTLRLDTNRHPIRLPWQSRMEALAGVTVFRHDFRDGIRWRPAAGGMYQPVNIEELLSQGVEATVQTTVSGFSGELGAGYTGAYTKASVTRPRFEGDESPGRQMLYVPRWIHRAWLQADVRGWMWMRASAEFVDARTTTFARDTVRGTLSAYRQLHLQSGITLSLPGLLAEVGVAVRNLTDERFEAMLGYPAMPRHYRCTIRLMQR